MNVPAGREFATSLLLGFLTKLLNHVNHFEQRIDVIYEDIYVTKTNVLTPKVSQVTCTGILCILLRFSMCIIVTRHLAIGAIMSQSQKDRFSTVAIYS